MDDGFHDLATSTSKRNRPVVGWNFVWSFSMERDNNRFLPIRRKYREIEDNVVDNRGIKQVDEHNHGGQLKKMNQA
jgi:hypothetical protein